MFAVLGLLIAQIASAPSPYWQQEVHYAIEATLDEAAERLDGTGRLVYLNRSPDTLAELYFHLHLNAFRPESEWTRAERRAAYDFQSLQEPAYGYERLLYMRTGGVDLRLEFPGAPDSVVVRVPLPDPLLPGDSVTLLFAWQARPATLCRRQCRRERSYDFAQWYPRIAPYDEGGWQAHTLYPQGEFYGEYGSYDVTLDLAEDQVVGATGVPVSGDPGWRPTPGSPRAEPLYNRDWYPASAALRLGSLTPMPASGRKRVRFRSEGTHHFAWSTSPDYLYEGGEVDGVGVHVLYRPGDQDWGEGAAVERTQRALRWLGHTFGPYPYPQLTNLHRLEGGGTEFPMVLMDGSASQSLILHEGAHQYAHGILGNNEWREGWLDEGMASFLTSWFFEDSGAEDTWDQGLATVAEVEGRGMPVAIGTQAEAMPDFSVYGYLTYTKPSIVLYQLRELLGADTFRRGLRAYYARKALQHVTESDLREALEYVSERDLGWFFDQWIRGTSAPDYALEAVQSAPAPEGGWTTRAVLVRKTPAWMPLTVRVGPVDHYVEARDARTTVEVWTADRPLVVEIDPERKILDTDRSDNRWEAGSS